MSNSIKAAAIALVAGLVIAGCGPQPQESRSGGARSILVSDTSNRSLDSAFGEIKSESQEISLKTPQDQLLAHREKVKGLLDQYSGNPALTDLDRARLAVLSVELIRLEAAIAYQDLRPGWEKMFKEAKLTWREQQKSVPERRAILRQQWSEFRRADDQLIAAERAYEDANNKMKQEVGNQTNLEGAGEPKP